MSIKVTHSVDATFDDEEYTYHLPIPGRRTRLMVTVDDAGYVVIEDTARRLSVRYVGDVDGGYAVHLDSHLPAGGVT